MACATANCLHQRVKDWEDTRVDRPKTLLHEFLAEALGTFVAIMFGNGVIADMQMQHGMTHTFGSSQYVNMGWGLGVCFGVLVSFESTGAHLNPAVTITNMIFSDMSPLRGTVYIIAQFVGAFFGAFVVTINYVVFKGGDALTNFYCTTPYEGVSYANAFFCEFVCSMLLVCGIYGIASGNPPVNKFHVAGFVGLLVFAIGNCFGGVSGFAMSPARDLGPRLVYAIFYHEYGGENILTDVFGDTYWLVPVVAPLLGGPVGALLYKICNHPEKRAEIAPATNKEFASATDKIHPTQHSL